MIKKRSEEKFRQDCKKKLQRYLDSHPEIKEDKDVQLAFSDAFAWGYLYGSLDELEHINSLIDERDYSKS